ncbi:sigma-54 interaction domain-containing protein [Clostridium estertheticum]|uniref:sigma-54 interaction domain-containing protein n=1 Tax=Clostridium estertheticum TaxID=238834 RepID=UPI00227D0324|nr:sigma 54-interacting transcriptional regulator [Clostridium estertheticum]
METLKSIGIVTNTNSQVAIFLKKNIEEIYKDFVIINSYFLDELLNKDEITDDVVLVMLHEKALEIENYVKNRENIIVIARTIKENEVYKIFNIPKGRNVLVVNDNKETTLETVSLLYRIGVNNIHLIPFDKAKNYEDIKCAITPGESHRVPEYIEKIIDIGNRCIDVSIFINIIYKLKLNSKLINTRLFKYSKGIVNLDSGINEKYRELSVKNKELDTVINMSREGILLIDTENIIVFYNKAFEKIFNLRGNHINCNMRDILDKNLADILKKELVKNELVEFKDKFLVINKEIIDYYGEKKACYINVNEVTYLKQLEENLSDKLKTKGLIARYDFNCIKTNSSIMLECITLGTKIASSDLTVLVTGESGTGKELFVQSIHSSSHRKNRPFVAINCAAVPESLLESELFGYDAGSFTGALKNGKAGLFEQANNGTIFLDEIGDMPLSLQARLLRVLQERQIMRIGSQKIININIRVIAATNKNLINLIEQGKFREDLFYRINVLPINIPPVRDRKEDIITLINYFIGEEKNIQLSDEVTNIFLSYPWPGNIREIQNVASYIALMSDSVVKAENLPYYIVNYGLDFSKELSFLESKNSLLNAIEVLKIIKKQNSLNLGVGRCSIEESLKLKNIILSEAEVRRIMSNLNKLAIISSSRGRTGSKITIKGNTFLNWVNNRLTI